MNVQPDSVSVTKKNIIVVQSVGLLMLRKSTETAPHILVVGDKRLGPHDRVVNNVGLKL